MDDSILTLLFYIGVLVLVSISKLFSNSLKSKKKVSAFLSENEDDNTDELSQTSSHFDLYHQSNVEDLTAFSERDSSIESFEGEGISVFKPINNSFSEFDSSSFETLQDETMNDEIDFIPLLANFDARAAVVYSEILKRPEY